jgi:hypothetical protein
MSEPIGTSSLPARRGVVRTVALSALAAALTCTLLAGQIGAAARLPVEASPIQFWDVQVEIDQPSGLAEPPAGPPEELAVEPPSELGTPAPAPASGTDS